MPVTSLYPVLMSENVTAAAAFYREVFGFAVTFDSDWYVSLRLDRFELAILDHTHPTIPDGFRSRSQGVLVNLEVDDVDSLYRELTTGHDLKLVLDLRDEDFGQRHFIVEAPDGVLVDVIQPIPFSGAYAESTADNAVPAS